jgi:Holliday junction resolvase RusA-like endonuclease
MSEFQFFLPMKKIPTATSQQKGIDFERRRVFTKPELLKVHAIYAAALAPHRPEVPLTGPVQVMTKWCFPSADPKRWGRWKATKPDVGNSTKLLHDVMEELGFFGDDCQIASEINQKFWTDPARAGIFVKIETLENA